MKKFIHLFLTPQVKDSFLNGLKHKNGKDKAEFVKKMHEQVKLQIEKKNEGYAKHANKGRKKVIFEPGDWVWMHMRKERFPNQRKSKLQPGVMDHSKC